MHDNTIHKQMIAIITKRICNKYIKHKYKTISNINIKHKYKTNKKSNINIKHQYKTKKYQILISNINSKLISNTNITY